jgi:hypothetical protein
VATKRERLAECEPTLPGKSAFDHGSPEDEDVNATVLPVGRCIFRHGQRRFRRGRTPRLNPGDASGLKLGNDLVGDFVIEVRRSWPARAQAVRFDIAGLRDGHREPLSQLVTRHGKTQPALLLSASCAICLGPQALIRRAPGAHRLEKWHPQEREHSDAEGGTRDRVQRRDRLRGHPGTGSDSDAGILMTAGPFPSAPGEELRSSSARDRSRRPRRSFAARFTRARCGSPHAL